MNSVVGFCYKIFIIINLIINTFQFWCDLNTVGRLLWTFIAEKQGKYSIKFYSIDIKMNWRKYERSLLESGSTD